MATVSRAFFDDFMLVHEAFSSSAAEIEEAKVVARGDIEAAERTYHSTAVMIRAGWKPLEQRLSDFLERTLDPEVLAMFHEEPKA